MKARPISRHLVRSKQRGLSAALVLGVMVVLGGMLAHAVTVGSSIHSGTAQELMQARALQAARAGLEWARYQVQVGPGSCVPQTNLAIPLSSGPTPLTMPVTVRCTLTGTHTEVSTVVRTYQLSANACSPAGTGGTCPNALGSADYVEWQVDGRADR